MATSTLLLITADPNSPLAEHAYRYAKAFIDLNTQRFDDINKCLDVFFYADAAHTANQLRWQTADRENLTTKWEALSHKHGLNLPVCVSTALTRGVSDADNAKRHQLKGANLAAGFSLVGLGELAQKLSHAEKVIQF